MPYRKDKSAPKPSTVEIISFIDSFINENGYSPSIRDICAGVNIASSSTVHAIMNKFHQDGYIIFNSKIARSIRLTPDGIAKMNERPR